MQIENRVQEQSETDSLANFRSLAESFRRTLLAENKSPRTVATYSESLTAFGNFLASQVMPGDPAHIKREPRVETTRCSSPSMNAVRGSCRGTICLRTSFDQVTK